MSVETVVRRNLKKAVAQLRVSGHRELADRVAEIALRAETQTGDALKASVDAAFDLITQAQGDSR